MDHKDFRIDQEFWTETGAWRCTDIGTRVIVAIKLGPRQIVSFDAEEDGNRVERHSIDDDPSWLDGPPYAVGETVFDEYDLEACYPTQEEMRRQMAK